jgi:hypothetical protein
MTLFEADPIALPKARAFETSDGDVGELFVGFGFGFGIGFGGVCAQSAVENKSGINPKIRKEKNGFIADLLG